MANGSRFPFLEKLKESLQIYGIDITGKRLLAAVSGGSDSTVMLDSLIHLRREIDFELRLCHVNHELRGKDAEADERFLIDLADKHELQLTVRRFEADEIERIREGNLEEMARELRYQRLAHTAQELSCDYIATAHTRSDQAETVLHRLLRSSGISGLAGIQPVATIEGETVIRPLLRFTSDEVLAYAKHNRIDYRMDSMNDDPQFTRVRIRKQLIPTLKQEFNPNIEESLAQLADIARDEEAFWQQHLEPFQRALQNFDAETPAPLQSILTRSKAEQRRIVRGMIKSFGIEAKMNHIEDCLRLLLGGKTQGEVHLPDGYRMYRRYESFYIASQPEEPVSLGEHELRIPGSTAIPELNLTVTAEIMPDNVVLLQNQQDTIARFDMDRIDGPVILRSRTDGDTIQPKGMEGRKKIKKIMQEHHVKLEDRGRIPIVCFGDEVAWIAGLCESNRYAVSPETKKILQLTLHKKR